MRPFSIATLWMLCLTLFCQEGLFNEDFLLDLKVESIKLIKLNPAKKRSADDYLDYSHVSYDGKSMVVRRLYSFTHSGEEYRMRIYTDVDPRHRLSSREVSKLVGLPVKTFKVDRGMSREFENEITGGRTDDYVSFIDTTEGQRIRRFVASTHSYDGGPSKDIITYTFDLYGLYSRGRVEIDDIWGNRSAEDRVNSRFINHYPDRRDPSIVLYSILDNDFRNLKLKDNEYIGKLGICSSGLLNIRERPKVTARILGKLETHERVVVLRRGARREKVGKLSDYWYEVENRVGVVGWVYGSYLEVFQNMVRIETETLVREDFITTLDIDYALRLGLNETKTRNYFLGRSCNISVLREYDNYGVYMRERLIQFEHGTNFIMIMLKRDGDFGINHLVYTDILDVQIIPKPSRGSRLSWEEVTIDRSKETEWMWVVTRNPPGWRGRYSRNATSPHRINRERGTIDPVEHKTLMIHRQLRR